MLLTLSNKSVNTAFLALLTLFAHYGAMAQDSVETVESRKSCDSAGCIEVDSWHLAVALGVGAKINPLVNGDDLPLVILPDIAYYGENWYWDNAEVGYQWNTSSNWNIESFVSVNTEKALFTFWHPGNLLLAGSFSSITAKPVGDDQNGNTGNTLIPPVNRVSNTNSSDKVSSDEVARRDWAFDGGFRFHYLSENSEWALTLATDVSDVYNGQWLRFDYSNKFDWQGWQIQPTLSVEWKSRKLTDYYYGLDAKDNLPNALLYEAKAGWQPAIKLMAMKPINDQWTWLVMAGYQHLHGGMRRSPIVNKKSIITAFAGVSYRF